MAHVQSRSTTGSGTSLQLAYLSDNGAGNLLVAGVGNGDGGDDLTTIADNSSNSWAERRSQVNTGDGLIHCALWRAPGVAVGANTVTASYSVSQFHIGMCIAEYDGMETTAPAVDGAVNSGQGFGTALNSGNVTTTVNNELMLSVGVAGDEAATFTNDAAYNERADTNGNRPVHFQDRIAATPVTDNATATKSGQNRNWAMCIATFKPATAAAGHPASRRHRGIPGARLGGPVGGSW